MKRLLTTWILALLATVSVWAVRFQSGGIFYETQTGNTVRVVYENRAESSLPNYENLSGVLTIPSSVSYEGTTYKVTAIQFSAFGGCKGITEVIIPNTVTSIGNSAFANCSALKKVTLPNSLTDIGSYVFMFCPSLTQVNIPNSLTKIGTGMFYGCTSLQELSIHSGVTAIGAEAFTNCETLKELTLPDAVEELGNNTFINCKSLTRVNIPSHVKKIGDCAFQNCIVLKEITLPEGLTDIGSSAFDGCETLKEVSIPNSVKNVEMQMFFNCKGLTKVTVGNGMKTIPTGMFSRCTSLQEVILPDGVTCIEENAFYECNSLEKVNIPSGVTSIGKYAFFGCRSLAQITIPDGVTVISKGVFKNAAIQEVTIPEGVTSIEAEAFLLCPNLREVNIPNKVQTVGNDAFGGCQNLTKLTIGSEVTSIGSYAFTRCKGLQEIYAKPAVPPTLGADAFYDVPKIPLIVPKASVDAYKAADVWNRFNVMSDELPEFTADGLKYQATGINTVTLVGYETEPTGKLDIPATVSHEGREYSVTGIDGGAFAYCVDLTEVTIPDNVTFIGANAFVMCYSITQMNLSASVTSIDETAFGSCTALKQINVDEANTTFSSVEGVLFDKDKTVLMLYPTGKEDATFVIPESVTTIKKAAFTENGSITRITIPDAVTVIERMAFTRCRALAELTLGKNVTTIGSLAFEGCPIRRLTIPNSLQVIDEYTFSGCSALEELTIGSGVTTLGREAFSGCSALKKMTVLAAVPPVVKNDALKGISRDIPVYVPAESLEAYKAALTWKTFTNLGMLPEFTADGLKYRIIDEENNRVEVTGYEGYVRENIPATVSYGGKDYSVTRIGNKAFAECFWVSSFTLPDGLTSIGEEAFSYCWELVEFTIPNSVETIEKAAFAYNFMQKITIGSGVKSIADEVFITDSDYGIAEMTVLAAVPPTVGTDAFRGTKRDIPVYVPAESLEAYKAAAVWKEFTNLQASQSSVSTTAMPESLRVCGGMLHNPEAHHFIIYDLTGRIIYSGNATTLSLTPGIYVVSCNGANGKVVF